MANNTLIIVIILMLFVLIILPIGFIIFIIKLSNRDFRRNHKNTYEFLRGKYRTNCAGVFKLYGGLPMPSNTMCEVAFCGNTIHIAGGNLRITIPVADINNIYIDTIQESYTRTSYYTNNPSALSTMTMIASLAGNAANKSAARKTLLIINYRGGVIAFYHDSYWGFDFLSKEEKIQLSGVSYTSFNLAQWIIQRFLEEKRNLCFPR